MSDFGPLEMEVFGLLCSKEPLSVDDVQKALQKKGRSLAYTTVMTVLVRLQGKGFVARRKVGRQYLYSQASHAEATKQSTLAKVREALFGKNRLKPILTLLDNEESLTAEELQELRDTINQKIKSLKEKK